MKKNKRNKNRLPIFLIISILLVYSTTVLAEIKVSYLYNLSDFTGTVPYNSARVSVDQERNEIYVLYQNSLRIFNEYGMEIYRFGDDLDLGQIVDVAIDQIGNIFLLSYNVSKSVLIRCNYRGEPKSKIELKNLPSDFSEFSPTRMIYQNGNFYLINHMGMKVVVVDQEGKFKNGYDLIPLFGFEEKDRANMEIAGFNVDKEGNILLTIPVLFKVCLISPDGKMTWFGGPGGSSGKFNVIAGIVRDSRENYLVVDKLKCAVMVFDKNFNFLTQFGYRGSKLGNLVAPDDIAIDKNGRIYVTQSMKRGVSVFRITYN